MNVPVSAFEHMNLLGERGIPFLFVIDFECSAPVAVPLNEAARHGLFYNLRGVTNAGSEPLTAHSPLFFEKSPVGFGTYQHSFRHAMEGLRFGNSYLLNLTFGTPVTINRSLKEIFFQSKAPYRLLFSDRFVVFSPECFVRISENTIRSFPMKGTIDAAMANAADTLLSDRKEMAEHHTIVDLIRNDLSMVACDVRVERFRYLEEIRTNQKHLLQASSEIAGTLAPGWRSGIGTLLKTLLPAGSVCGAPKTSTMKLIGEAEPEKRGYYTGIFGIFDGCMLDSGVMIRFIEKTGDQMVFRSGGGITVNSLAEHEYQEMIDKVYVPIV